MIQAGRFLEDSGRDIAMRIAGPIEKPGSESQNSRKRRPVVRFPFWESERVAK